MLIAASSEQIRTPTAIALGNFDGIHQGHCSVLRSLIDDVNSSSQPHIYPSVVSFTPHPREYFTGEKRQLLTPIPQKAELLADLGIEQLILLPFDRNLSSLAPEEFVVKILVEQLQAKQISVGVDFRFGYQRKGTGIDLKTLAAKYNIEVKLNSLYTYQNASDEKIRVSSSLIRQALKSGEIETANQMLGRAYSLQGEVVTGKQLGRTIGFPTANLEIAPEKFLPRFGVYAVDVFLDDTALKGIMNIGCRPTVAGEYPTIEVHILNWSGDLYGRNLKVNLIGFIRPEQKFASVEALKQQISQDCQLALESYL